VVDIRPYQQVGTLMHMVWECERVCEFWEKITSVLSDMIGKDIPAVLLGNDDSYLGLAELERKVWSNICQKDGGLGGS